MTNRASCAATGDADDTPARSLEGGGPEPIALESSARPGADQPSPVVAAQLEQKLLEVGPGGGGPGDVRIENGGEHAGAAAARERPQ
jgi:hypothetical protein